MRIKNRLYCDFCGKLLRKLSDKEMGIINKARQEGSRLSLIADCSCRRKNEHK